MKTIIGLFICGLLVSNTALAQEYYYERDDVAEALHEQADQMRRANDLEIQRQTDERAYRYHEEEGQKERDLNEAYEAMAKRQDRERYGRD